MASSKTMIPNNGRHARKTDATRIRRDQARSQRLQEARQLDQAQQLLPNLKQ